MNYGELKKMPSLEAKILNEIEDSKRCSIKTPFSTKEMIRLIELKQKNLSLSEKAKMIEAMEGYHYPSFAELKRVYESVCISLREKHKFENTRTSYEFVFLAKIRAETKIKLYTSVWIGNRNIDLFLPSVISDSLTDSKFYGMAFEIDGEIHNEPLKMAKDQSKYQFLDSLGIAVVSIPNHDLNHSLVRELIKKIKTFRRLDTRGRQRVWRKVYTETILNNGTNEQITQLWGKIFKDD